MNKRIGMIIIVCALSFFVVRLGFCSRGINMVNSSYNIKELKDWFLIEPERIREVFLLFKDDATEQINKIISIPDTARTYENTYKAFDNLCALSNIAIFSHLCSILESVSPRKEVRDAAHETIILIQGFFVDQISGNKKLYLALKAYALNPEIELLNPEQRYFIDETISGYERHGMALPDDQLEKVCQLKKEISSLEVQFERNIAEDTSYIVVNKEDLEGLDDQFINGLNRTPDNLFMLGVDYPTFYTVMENCITEETRKKLSRAFNNRAYPMNEVILKDILSKRTELAHLLGFESYAHLDLVDQMAKSPEQVTEFLQDLKNRSHAKALEELFAWKKELPSFVTIREDGKLNPWDLMIVQALYKKKHFNIDERTVAEYFPLEQTIKGLFAIYEAFFNVTLKTVETHDLWHPDVLCMQLFNKEETILYGTIFLDLFPRDGKFTHAAQAGYIPAFFQQDGTRHPGAVVVMANFPKPSKEQPSLLQRNDVSTFFHEFGHALHSLFGATPIASLCGTSVKRDFVELPSQMLEEWLWDKNILKSLSCHYKTGDSLDDNTIDNILALKNLNSGTFLQRQVWLSMISLQLHDAQFDGNPYKMLKEFYNNIITGTAFDEENHMYASFGHLCGYDAKYYGYMWSKVFALDLFYEIKKEGLLNPSIGCRYANLILGKGGTQDPNDLLINFLSRKPCSNAFFADMGLSI